MLEAEGNAACHGPITQAHFLEALGIRERLQGLLQRASQEEGEQLISGYYRLVGSSSSDANTQAQVCMLLAGFAIACSTYVCAGMRLCQRKLHAIFLVLHGVVRSEVNLGNYVQLLTCWEPAAQGCQQQEASAVGTSPSSKSKKDEADSVTQAAREEGMGTTYKAFTITPSSRAVPIPF